MTKWLSSVRGGRLIVLGALVALALAATAPAFFSSTGTGSASAATSALSAPTSLAGTPGAGTVSLSWHAVTPPASGPVTYYLTRNGGTPGGNCPASTAPASGTSCTDSGLSPGTYHYTVTALWRSWSATSATVNVTVASGAATKIVLSGSTASLTSGTGRTLTATIEDASGNTVTTGPDSTATITFAQSAGAGSVTGLTTVAASRRGRHRHRDRQTGGLGHARRQRHPRRQRRRTPTRLSLTVVAGTASQLVLSGSTANLSSATTRALTATIEDANGNTVTTGSDSTDTITFAQTTGAGSLSGLRNVAAGRRRRHRHRHRQARGCRHPARQRHPQRQPRRTPTRSEFSVAAGTASQLVLSGSTANLTSGATRTLTATIEDANGNTVTTGSDSTDTITFAQTAGAGSLSGLGNVAAVAGVATETVTGKLAGAVTLGASGTLDGSATNSNTAVVYRRRRDRQPDRTLGLDRQPDFGGDAERDRDDRGRQRQHRHHRC